MEHVDLVKRKAIRYKLLRWFARNKRTFPWRGTFETPDPYVILFTEIMLQRTRADQVVPVYDEFLKRYPTFERIKRAPDEEIISLFARLGLRWRARKVVELIAYLARRYDGLVPREMDILKELPGVGDYVAKAVMCYAYGERVAPIDSNVARVISRLFGISQKADTARRNRKIASIAVSLIPERQAKDFNLSLLDFAALVCKPNPVCPSCPLNMHCEYVKILRTSELS